MLVILIVIYIVFISLGLPDSLFGVVWPVVHTELSVPESFASVYSIIVSLSTGGVSFISGKLLRRFGTARVTFFSILLTAAGLVGISFSPHIAVMIIFSVILGYGAGAIDTGLNNFVSLHYKAQHMNWLHCFWGVGVTVSPLIMSVFLGNEGAQWRNGYRVVALLQLIIALIVLPYIKKWNKMEAEKREEKENGDQGEVKLRDILKIKGVLTGILSLGFYCSMEFILGTWGASYIVNVYGLPADAAAKFVSLYYCGIMFGRMIAGFLSKLLNDNQLIKAGTVLSVFGMILLVFTSVKLVPVGLFLIGTGFGPVFPSVLHSVPGRFGTKYSADITGFHMGGAYAVGFTSVLIYGFVATNTTFLITPFVILAFAVLLFVFNEITIKSTAKTLKNTEKL